MPYLVVENFRAGLDTRRLYETSPAGTLIELTNAHISQGGEIEQRKAFVLDATLPANCYGLYGFRGEILVFGSDEAVAVPAGYRYIQLTVPGDTPMVAVRNANAFAGKVYVIAEFNDGSIHHFYNGVRVEDWFDGRARAEFRIDSGIEGEFVPATYEQTRVSFFGVPKVGTGTLAGVPVELAAPDAASLNLATAKIASDLMASGLFSDVVQTDATLNITYAMLGHVPAGVKFDEGYVGDTGLVASVVITQAGVDEVNIPPSKITEVLVNGVDSLIGAITWDTDAATTAIAVAAQINARTTNPDYDAVAIANRVIVAAALSGTGANGQTLAVNVADGAVVTVTSATFAGGAVVAGTYSPGLVALAAKAKMYAVSDSLVHFSELNNPAEWNPPAVGAGFIDMSTQAPEGGDVKTLAPYFNFHAVFSESNIQIWEFDVDELKNVQRQVLNNTGTIAPQSVVSFGSNDVFYLHYTGIRSLRARDTTTSAAVTDIGTAIDELITMRIAQDETDARLALGVVNPADGRYWLAIGETIYVFSYFPGSQISAWSTYSPGFRPDHFSILNGQVIVRSGNQVFKYGGDSGNEYDASEVSAWLPYLDMEKAATHKHLLAVDFAAQGTWQVYLSSDHTRPDIFEYVGESSGSTYSLQTMACRGIGTHISLKFTRSEASRGRLGGAAIHYNLGDAL